jgi:RsiW-degrading membrane proteinase PrsW (M82 family)
MSGITFGVAAGMGFAALETMGYAFVAFIQSGGNIGTLEETLLVRGLLSPAGHAAWTGLICATLWRERARLGRPVINRAVVGAFALAVVLHALWDMFNSLRGPTFVDWLGVELISLGIAIISLTLLIRRVREAEQRSAPLVEAETPPSPAS